MISDEIERLVQLRNSGSLSEDEFLQAKQRVLNGQTAERPAFFQQTSGMTDVSGRICGVEPKIWLTLMHASQLLTWTAVGVVAPFVMWLLSRDQSREANRHGLMILNWMLSSLVYFVVAGLACFTIVGFVIGAPMFAVLVVVNIVFPIIGALQASSGQLWRYPFTINFFDPDAI